MKVLIDTNIVLDLLLNRDGADDAEEIFSIEQSDGIERYFSASAVTDVFYVMCKHSYDSNSAQTRISDMLEIISILPVSDAEITDALAIGWKDFEDAVQYSVAKNSRIDYIITKNKKDYVTTVMPVVTPKEFMNIWNNS